MSGLLPWAPGLRISVGVPGAGKSYGIREDAKAAARHAMPLRIVDPEGEWTTIPNDIAPYAARIVPPQRLADCATRVGVITHKLARESRADMEEACTWAMEGRGRGVICHEAWMVAARGNVSETVEALARTWRHTDTAVWMDAQRVTLISRDIIDIATEVRIYTQVGDRDFAILREIGGRELVNAIGECGARFDKGEAGWHVTLRRSRRPPYEIER